MKKTHKKQRHKSRQYALALLYLIEMQDTKTTNEIEIFWEESRTSDSIKKFANDLITGVSEHRSEIEKCISHDMTGWKLEKIEILLRNLLLLATYEMLWKQTPVKIIINEAIILAKEFINYESAPLVNKVLQKIYDSKQSSKIQKE